MYEMANLIKTGITLGKKCQYYLWLGLLELIHAYLYTGYLHVQND